jgi:hypothetical protein
MNNEKSRHAGANSAAAKLRASDGVGSAADHSVRPPNKQVICKLVRRAGRRPTLVPYHQPDARFEQLQHAQLAVEGLIDDSRMIQARVDELVGGIKQLAVDLAELNCRHQSKRTQQ